MLTWLLDKLMTRAQKLSARQEQLSGSDAPTMDINALVKGAYALHLEDKLDAAEAAYRKILFRHPNHADTLFLLADIVRKHNDPTQAIALVNKAIAADPNNVAFHAELVSLSLQVDDLPTAEAGYRKIIELDEKNAEYLNDLGALLQKQNRLAEALDCYERALALNPDLSQALYNAGSVYKERNDWDRALDYFEQAIANTNENLEASRELVAQAHFDYGLILSGKKQYSEAIAQHKRGLELHPDSFAAWANMGNDFGALNQHNDALKCYVEAIKLNPECIQAHSAIALTLERMGNAAQAQKTYQQIREIIPSRNWPEIDPNHPFPDLLIALAIIEYALSLEYSPDLAHIFAVVHLNKGVLLDDLGRYVEALKEYEEAIALNPKQSEAHANRGIVLLRLGRFEAGWDEYEYRLAGYNPNVNNERGKQAPMWTGEALTDAVLLVHTEQGLGDTIQFIRYYKQVAARCKNIIVECQPPLKYLLENMCGVPRVYASGDELPPFDYQIPLLSLPRVFKTRLENIPAEIPYVLPIPDDVAHWKSELAKYDGQFKVGLVWAGSLANAADRFRSLSLSELSPLAECANVAFFSLQKTQPGQTTSINAHQLTLISCVEHLSGFRDAAFIANLDLVITVDTSVAHLAGAMGKRVWVLLPFNPDWRWMLEREDTPWYPTMRLFRQHELGNWGDCINEMQKRLFAEQNASP